MELLKQSICPKQYTLKNEQLFRRANKQFRQSGRIWMLQQVYNKIFCYIMISSPDELMIGIHQSIIELEHQQRCPPKYQIIFLLFVKRLHSNIQIFYPSS